MQKKNCQWVNTLEFRRKREGIELNFGSEEKIKKYERSFVIIWLQLDRYDCHTFHDFLSDFFGRKIKNFILRNENFLFTLEDIKKLIRKWM